MADDVSRLRAKRGGHRGIITKYSKEAASLLETDTETDPETKIRCLVTIKDSLQKRLSQITKFDEDILKVCDTKEIENYLEESDVVNAHVIETIEACDRFLKSSTDMVTRESHPPSSDTEASPDKTVLSETDVTSDKVTKEGSQSESEAIHGTVETKAKKESHTGGARLESEERSLSTAPKPKLPKLVLPRFKGDITMF